MNSYKLNETEYNILYDFTLHIICHSPYKYIFNNLPTSDHSYSACVNILFNIILPNSSVIVKTNDTSTSDILLSFNSDKDLTLFLLTKDKFFNYLHNNDYNALDIN